jgi:hypothetical protein
LKNFDSEVASSQNFIQKKNPENGDLPENTRDMNRPMTQQIAERITSENEDPKDEEFNHRITTGGFSYHN